LEKSRLKQRRCFLPGTLGYTQKRRGSLQKSSDFLEFRQFDLQTGNRTLTTGDSISKSSHSVTRLIEGLRGQDPHAAEQIWRRYFERLLPLARAKIGGLPHRAMDEEDVLVSVFDRFFRAAKEHRFARLNDRDDLWQILLMLTERKVADQYRAAGAEKRGGEAVRQELPRDADSLGELAAREPGPEFVASFNENLARALHRLGEQTTREVALLRMEGFENREIAARLAISLSSVERKLRVIREVWREEFAV
jgi:DNA-directed RNA polymerase specialized sigma24 family protein